MHRRTIPSLRTLQARSYAVTAAARPPLSGLTSTSRARAEKLSAEWKGTSATGDNTKNFIGGEFIESRTSNWIEVVDPVRTTRIDVKPTELKRAFTGVANTAH